MISKKTGHFGRIATASSLVLLLALAGCGGSGDSGETINTEDKGPLKTSDTNKAGIYVSNICTLASDENTGKPVLRVNTTIVDDSDDDVDVVAYLKPEGITVIAEEKGKGKQAYEQVGEASIYTGIIGVNETNIQLCGDHGSYLGPADTRSLNASVTVSVINDGKGDYYNQCDDDPATDGIDESNITVSAAELNLRCSQ